MNFFDWLRPGLKIKRWLAIMILGIVCIVLGAYPVMSSVFLKGIGEQYAPVLMMLGVLFIFAGAKQIRLFLINFLDMGSAGLGYRNPMDKISHHKKILMKGPKVVVIGGGTGLSVLLRGMKKFTSNITAIVTMADDGGGSGKLREDLGMLPPGDIRNCILALANTEPIMERLLQYRFEEGSLRGQSFGNLLIAAMNGISDNFEEAIRKMNDVLAVTGKVLPVTTEDITLYAKLKNGKVIKGESQIPIKVKELNSEIEQVFMKPEHAKPLKESLEAISSADVIVLGPGSLYTSVIPNLLVEDLADAVKKSRAVKVYVANVMTQPGETDGYGVWRHVESILCHTKGQIIDYVFVNHEDISPEVLQKYAEDGAQPVQLTMEDRKRIMEKGMKIIEGPFVEIKKQYIRHDAVKLSEQIMKLALEEKYATDKFRILDYYYLHDKLKKMTKG
ncbi:gluconeogenesis factor YvcK family protein [Thermotalea metallivorans]|uniref:Putative gluconeogenesis factor n=1 Tax=Thermotalea metallivorans TaxID=520762 RepID=A0A140L265_9FIRM|nr:YvcK family protein [Thermotalea metallivorans]KXG74640.1 Gluconeogenesis factor [Thermotalea metallivorans]